MRKVLFVFLIMGNASFASNRFDAKECYDDKGVRHVCEYDKRKKKLRIYQPSGTIVHDAKQRRSR